MRNWTEFRELGVGDEFRELEIEDEEQHGVPEADSGDKSGTESGNFCPFYLPRTVFYQICASYALI